MNALSISKLQKTYKSGFHALKGVDLEVAKGDFFGLLGPNGAGKTTTIGIITSLVTKSAGTVKVYGIDIDEDFPKAKKLIGVVPQEFNFSIFEKVQDIVTQQAGYYGIPRAQALANAERYLRQLGLWEKRNNKAQELSGGMKRRLMIARGLIHEPELLILDEPTAGVDVELRRGMWDFLVKLNQTGKTIILTTHYLEEAEQLCNTIAIIQNGRIIENTDKKTLLKKVARETFVLEVTFKNRDPIPPLDGAAFTVLDDATMEVTKLQTLSMTSVVDHLNKQAVTVDSIRSKYNRLEELFMDMVNNG